MAALTFGPYTLIERIGIGARSEVYRARKKSDSTGGLVALKRVLAGAAHDRETQLILAAEAELLKTLHHDGVVRVFDDGIVSGVAYVVYELVEGADLEKVLTRARARGMKVPLDFAFSVAAQLLDALAYVHTVHSLGGDTAASKLNAPGTTIIHRDVCPSNVLVSRTGAVRLADFGIAKVPGRNTTTGVGEIKGTIRYMSPEQVRGVPLDPRSDLYSVGALLLELFNGPALYGDLKPLEVLKKVAANTPAWDDADPNLGLPAEILPILRKVLAKNPAERYDTAAQVLEALSGAAEKLSVNATPSAIARTMADLFGDEQGTEVEESRIMADEKGGSDLDVFEGLAKKSARPSNLPGAPPPSMPAPAKSTATPLAVPPPASMRAGGNTATLVGVAAPALPPPAGAPVSGLPPPPPSIKPPQRSGTAPGLAPSPGADAPKATPLPPPPPPTKSAASDRPPMSKAPNTLVAAVPPPPASIGSALGMPSVKAPPPPKEEAKDEDKEEQTPPKGTAKAKGLDMDWEDDEESTHVFENQKHGLQRVKKPTGDVAPASKVGAAAALLASSGGSAAARPSSLPVPAAPPIPIPPPVAPTRASEVPAPPPVPVAAHQSRERIEPVPVSRRKEGSSGKIALGLAALAMIAIVGLAVYMFIPRTGQLKIDVKLKSGSPITTAAIYVDGVKVCDTAPCLVNKVDGGSRAVKAVVGDLVVTENATVEPGKERSVFLTIDDSGKEKPPVVASTATTAPTAPPAPEGTGIKVKGPAGVKLLVDGKDRGAFEAGKEIALTDLTPGEHKIKFDGGESYESVEKSITVSKDAITDMGEQKPKVLKGKLSLELKTDGAQVTLSGKQDGKTFQKEFKDDNWAKQPLVLKNLDPKGELKITAKKKGFKDLVETISFPDGEAEKTLVIDLASDAAPTPVPTNTATAPTNTATATNTTTATTTAAPASGPATITMNSIPISKVVLDGKPLGNTPQSASVPAGPHTVMFIHPEKGRKSVSVTVKPGEKKPVSVKF